MDLTKSIGSVTELQCISKFIEMGFNCSIPHGDAAKYDFIADINGKLLKIQCKSSHNPKKKNGERDTEAFMFNCVTQTTNTKKTTRHRYDSSEIDYFATYFNGNVYVVPLRECSIVKTLRFSPPTNSTNNYNKAEDYLIEKVFGEVQSADFLFQLSQNKNKKEEKEIFLCTQCQKNEVYSKNNICVECKSFNERKTACPTREELKSLIRTKPFLKLGENFGVSDSAIRKWCKYYNLPSTKKDIDKISDEEWGKI